jgi:hypothetical protein
MRKKTTNGHEFTPMGLFVSRFIRVGNNQDLLTGRGLLNKAFSDWFYSRPFVSLRD